MELLGSILNNIKKDKVATNEEKEKANEALACIFSACFLELEHQKALRATNQLLRSLKNEENFITGQSIAPSDLIASIGEIDKQRADSLTGRLRDANYAREIVFKAHKNPEKLDKNKKVTFDKDLLPEVYHAKGVLRQLFELVDPRLLVPQRSPSPEVGSRSRQLELLPSL
jgi:hypothetical protein